MSKRLLMLSTAVAALFTSAALADTTISDSQTNPYKTGAKVSTDNTSTKENSGNITITNAGSVTSSGYAQGAITINTNNWLLQQGSLTAKDNDGASAIRVDMSANPNMTGTSISGVTGSTTQPVTAIYLDSASVTSASGSGKSKYGIYLDSTSCTAVCTLTGAVTLAGNSTLAVSGGDTSVGIQLGSSGATTTNYAVLKGDLTINGTVTATSATTTNTATGMYGLASYGQIDGNLIVGGSITTYGHGGYGMYLAGMGITGSLQINGAVTSTANVSSNLYNPTQKINTTTNPEAGPALDIGASIAGGVSIGTAGGVKMQGASSAIAISPASIATTTALTLGVYTGDNSDPGFSFYNRGAVAAQYTNFNKAAAAVELTGSSTTVQTILTGGFYDAGSITATSQTSNDATSSTDALAYGFVVGPYTRLEPNTSTKNAATATDPGDQAALVVSGSSASIAAQVTGTRGGTARAIWISGSNASVPSLINTGTISATVLTTNAALGGGTRSDQAINGYATSTDPVAAIAIEDDSGSLVSIINSGTISAVAGYSTALTSSTATGLNNDHQVAIAILLGTGDNQTIQNLALSKTASIAGDVLFGNGNNQLLELIGTGGHYSIVSGNVAYGEPDASGGITTSGDRLHIGFNGILTGRVTTAATVVGSGVQVDIDTKGTLNLLNTTTPLQATTVTVANGGTLNLGVNRQLTTSGMIQAQSVNFLTGSNLGVNYASFLPASTQAGGTYQFVLMTSDPGQMQISQTTLDGFNNPTNSTTSANNNRPYLLKQATMCVTTQVGCIRPTGLPVSQDALVIDVVAKTPTEIGLTAGSVAITPVQTTNGTATTLFQQANLALAAEDELGSAFLRGITSAAQAQKAYNEMAPGLTGGTRAIAISITDSATGPVATRQRALRMYGKTQGDFTLWGQEFVQMLKDPGTGATDPNTGFKLNPGFKDHGFGIALGIDGGSPKYGWYGGAFTFYAGDVNELSRNAHQNQQWYLLSLYSDWRGKGLFLDTKVDAGYGHIDGKRTLNLSLPDSTGTYITPYTRTAENKHAGALIAGSIVTGAMVSYGAATFMPQLNLDAMYLREEGYTESNPTTTTVGDGFDLKVNQYYAKSLRAFVGLDARYDLKLWDFYLQPEARAGYRYDFISDPVKLKAAFAYSNVTTNSVGPGDTFELTGPDPSQGNFVLGGTIAATTDTWTLGLNFDLVKGSNGAFQQVGTLHILGRI